MTKKEAKSTLLTLKHLFEDEQILKALDVAISAISGGNDVVEKNDEVIDLKGQGTIVTMSIKRAKERVIKTLRAEPSDLLTHEEAWTQIGSDLISRADAIKAIKGHDERTKTDTLDDTDIGYSAGLDMAIEIINKMPSVSAVSREEYDALCTKWIEAEQRADYYDVDGDDIASGCVSAERVGEWQYEKMVMPLSNHTKDSYRCSVCHTHWDCETNYCPNCGARMENKK